MLFFSRAKTNEIKCKLVRERQMTSLLEQELALVTDALKRETVNWVPMWVDLANYVRSDLHSATATRAITDAGELLWYVCHDTKKHGYHAEQHDPFDAIEAAQKAWDHRRAVRAEWARVEQARRDLLLGRRKFRVTVQDAYDSALCALGTKWFMKRIGIAKSTTVSGRTAALLMKIEPQMGFVIHQAMTRETAEYQNVPRVVPP